MMKKTISCCSILVLLSMQLSVTLKVLCSKDCLAIKEKPKIGLVSHPCCDANERSNSEIRAASGCACNIQTAKPARLETYSFSLDESLKLLSAQAKFSDPEFNRKRALLFHSPPECLDFSNQGAFLRNAVIRIWLFPLPDRQSISKYLRSVLNWGPPS